MSYLQKRFYLFNCDNTYNLEIVERFLLEVEEKYGPKFSVDRLYFGLQRMAEVYDRIIPTLDMNVAVFFVNANESRLSINQDNRLVTRESIQLCLKKQVGFSYLLMARFPLHDLVKRSFRYAHCSLVIYLPCLPLTRYISFKNARTWLVILLIHIQFKT